MVNNSVLRVILTQKIFLSTIKMQKRRDFFISPFFSLEIRAYGQCYRVLKEIA